MLAHPSQTYFDDNGGVLYSTDVTNITYDSCIPFTIRLAYQATWLYQTLRLSSLSVLGVGIMAQDGPWGVFAVPPTCDKGTPIDVPSTEFTEVGG